MRHQLPPAPAAPLSLHASLAALRGARGASVAAQAALDAEVADQLLAWFYAGFHAGRSSSGAPGGGGAAGALGAGRGVLPPSRIEWSDLRAEMEDLGLRRMRQ
jgi:hypothetical protein